MTRKTLASAIFAFVSALAFASGSAQSELGIEIPELRFDPPAVEAFQLENGLNVFFYEDHSLPVVTIDLFVKSGELLVPPDKTGLAELCGTLMRSGGTLSTPPDQFDAELDFVAASLSSRADVESAIISLRVLRDHMEKCTGLMSQMIREPRFAEDKLEIARENMMEEIRRENDNPHNTVRREFYKRLFPDHPYGSSPTLSSVEKLSRQDILDHFTRTYGPEGSVLAISGDLSRAEAEDLVKRYFADWKSQASAATSIPEIRPSVPGIYHAQRDQAQTYFRFGHRGISMSDPNRYAVEVMNNILGSGGFLSRLVNAVRVERGLAYNVGSSFYSFKDAGAFYAYCQTKASTTCEAIDLMIEVIKKFQAEGPTQKELEVAKDAIINADVFSYATPQQVATERAGLEFFGFPADEAKARIDAIRRTTVEDVRRGANEFLRPDELIIIVVGDSAQFDRGLSSYGTVQEIDIN